MLDCSTDDFRIALGSLIKSRVVTVRWRLMRRVIREHWLCVSIFRSYAMSPKVQTFVDFISWLDRTLDPTCSAPTTQRACFRRHRRDATPLMRSNSNGNGVSSPMSSSTPSSPANVRRPRRSESSSGSYSHVSSHQIQLKEYIAVVRDIALHILCALLKPQIWKMQRNTILSLAKQTPG